MDWRQAGLCAGEPPSPLTLERMSNRAELAFLAGVCPAALLAAWFVPLPWMLVVVPVIFIGGYVLSVKVFK